MNKIKSVLLILFLGIIISLSAQNINQTKSIVNFEISKLKVKTVKGSFGGMSGTVKFNPSDLKNSNFKVCINPATVNTENKKRDNHLRTADFFNVEKYPVICFTSEDIRKSQEGYIVTGKLSMHGVTKSVTGTFTHDKNTLKGTTTVKRLDFGVGESTSTFMVANEVTLTIICVLEN